MLYPLPGKTFIINGANLAGNWRSAWPLARLATVRCNISSRARTGRTKDIIDVAPTAFVVAGTRSSDRNPPQWQQLWNSGLKLTKSASIDGNWDDADPMGHTTRKSILNKFQYVRIPWWNQLGSAAQTSTPISLIIAYCTLIMEMIKRMRTRCQRQKISGDKTPPQRAQPTHLWVRNLGHCDRFWFAADGSDDSILGYIWIQNPLTEVFSYDFWFQRVLSCKYTMRVGRIITGARLQNYGHQSIEPFDLALEIPGSPRSRFQYLSAPSSVHNLPS